MCPSVTRLKTCSTSVIPDSPERMVDPVIPPPPPPPACAYASVGARVLHLLLSGSYKKLWVIMGVVSFTHCADSGRGGVTPRCWGSRWDATDLEPLHTREVKREVIAQLCQQRDPPLRRVTSDFQEETAGQRQSKGDGEDPTAQLYTGLFSRLEDFCAGDELAEVSDVEYVVYEEDDGKVVERGRI